MGGDFRINRFMLDQVTHPRGEFTFASAATAIPSDSAAQNGYANAMASFLLDVPVAIERGLVAVSDVGAPLDERHRGGRHKSMFTYIHDKWQVRPNITLDFGLRHEVLHAGGWVSWPGAAWSTTTRNQHAACCGLRRHPRNLGVQSYWKNFNPRTGISWRLNDTNVLRAGYGVSAEGGPSPAGQIYPITQAQSHQRTKRLHAGWLIGHRDTGSLLRA